MDHHYGKLDYHIYMSAILIPMLLLCSIRNLKYLSPFSMFANALQIVGLALIFFYLLQDLPKSWQRKYFATWYKNFIQIRNITITIFLSLGRNYLFTLEQPFMHLKALEWFYPWKTK